MFATQAWEPELDLQNPCKKGWTKWHVIVVPASQRRVQGFLARQTNLINKFQGNVRAAQNQGEWLPEECLRLFTCAQMYSHPHTCAYPYRHKHKLTCSHSRLQWYTQYTTDYSHCFTYHLHLILSVWIFSHFFVLVTVIVWLLNVYSELMCWSLGPQLMVLLMSDEKFRGGIYVEEGGHWEHVFGSFVSEYLFLDDHVAISFHFRHGSAMIQYFSHKPKSNEAGQL